MNIQNRLALLLMVALGLPLLVRAWFLHEQMQTFTWQLHKSTFVADALFVMLALPNLIYLFFAFREGQDSDE